MKQLLLLITTIIASSFFTQAQDVYVNYGDTWKYYDAGNTPASNGGFNWTQGGYNDASWASGPAQLGYGDGDEATLTDQNALTTYFRLDFNVTDATIYDQLDLNLIYDDGAVVYLNGTQIWKVNMPNGNINYSTLAANNSGDNSYANNLTNSNLLQTGTNTLAVEIHQRTTGSSDISFDFELEAQLIGFTSITRGPYLQMANDNSVVIKWRTDDTTESIVDYGTSLGALNQNITDNTLSTDHEVQITGLAADTKYYYEISNTVIVLQPAAADLYFKTYPTPGVDHPLKAWILGDCGTASNNQRNVRDAYYNFIGADHTDMMLFLGDNAYNDGTDAQYQNAFFNIYDQKLKNTIAWSTLGNHDGHSADSNTQTGPYYDIFTFPKNGESGGLASGTEAYYSYDYGNVHFIVLDSHETNRAVGGTMYNWALNDIQNTTAKWIVAYWHHPPYTKGSHNSDTEGQLIAMRENFIPMLESNGVDLVLSGHSHSYERSYLLHGHTGYSNSFNSATHTIGATGYGDGQIAGDGNYEKYILGPEPNWGAVYITAGSSGKITGNGSLAHPAMHYSVKQLGSCYLEVNGDTLHLKFIRETGAIDDQFTIVKDICNYGLACDDLDDCTINDQLDANCDCNGTYVDADGDGVCFFDDCDDNDNTVFTIIGTACNDNDPCTINDEIVAGCGCVGTFEDTDGDGTCDADDCFPNDPTLALPGDACNDLDPCTINDVLDAACNCTGTFSDADGDGVCTADDCDDNDFFLTTQLGSTCNDNDPCTVNDVIVAGCGCVGTFADADGDGVCNANDCRPNNAAISNPGDACNDNDPCTINDVIDNTCLCVGTLQDADGDGVCTLDDCDDNDPNQTATIGSACNDGDPCTTNDIVLAGCGCQGTFQDWDSDGVCDANDCAPFNASVSGAGDPCNDGNVCTTNDVYDANCNCNGTFTDADADGVCDTNDCSPYNPNATVIDACGNCSSGGLPLTNWPLNPLTHTGSGSNSTTIVFPTMVEDISFSIYNMNNVTNGPSSNRYMEKVTFSYVNQFGFTTTYSPLMNVSSYTYTIPGMFQSLTIKLEDGDSNGSSGSNQMSISLTSVSYCGTPAACEDYYYIQNTVPSNLYEVTDSIRSIGLVPSNGNVTFEAGINICLEPGFEVDQNANFEATIETCP